MKISIIIPTIGSPSKDVIQESLESALNSNGNIWSQIIIIDNSKSDQFHRFLIDTCGKDRRVEIHQVNTSLTMAECWNEGLQYVQNEWIVYLHDDDILKSENLPKNVLNKNIGFINFGFEVFGNESWTYYPKLKGLKGICINTPKLVSTIINTKALKAIGGWDLQSGYYLDFLAFLKLDFQFGSESYTQVLGKYRLHASNASSQKSRNQKYGDALPYVISEAFKIVKDETQRREILFSTISFTYTNNAKSKKILSKVVNFFGQKAWLK